MRHSAVFGGVIYCPICQCENQDSANFCIICGFRLDQKMVKLRKYIGSMRSRFLLFGENRRVE